MSDPVPSRRLMEEAAAARRYPFPDRAAHWRERFAVNQRELEAFAAAPEPDSPPLLSPPGEPATAGPGVYPVVPAATSDDLCAWPALTVAAAVGRGLLSPVEVAEAHLRRIDAHGELNAFITVRADDVLAQAKAVADRLAGGETLPLAGVPVAIKDIVAVRGYPMTGGSRAIDPATSAEDAPVVAALRRAGCVVVGTANLHELAYGITSANPHFGRVGNPHGADRIAGGSSGGSAAAVAAGLAALAIGTDTAGSIRIPAACCGVVGLKPGYDALSRDGVLPLAWSLDHVGPLARTVTDAALMFEAMAGLPPGSTVSQTTAGPRIAGPPPYFRAPLAAPVAAALERVLEGLRSDGATLVEADVDGLDLAPAVQFMTICPEATQANWSRLIERPDDLGDDVRVRLEIGQFLFGVDYVKAQRLRNQLRRSFLELFRGADVLITPTLATTAPLAGATTVVIGGKDWPVHTALTRFTLPFNLTGLPALTLPVGRDDDGLPIGLQVAGPPGGEAAVLIAAAHIERLVAETG